MLAKLTTFATLATYVFRQARRSSATPRILVAANPTVTPRFQIPARVKDKYACRTSKSLFLPSMRMSATAQSRDDLMPHRYLSPATRIALGPYAGALRVLGQRGAAGRAPDRRGARRRGLAPVRRTTEGASASLWRPASLTRVWGSAYPWTLGPSVLDPPAKFPDENAYTPRLSVRWPDRSICMDAERPSSVQPSAHGPYQSQSSSQHQSGHL